MHPDSSEAVISNKMIEVAAVVKRLKCIITVGFILLEL